MNILYFDCMSGISGDMAVGALIDLGIEPNLLVSQLQKLNICDEYTIKVSRILKRGIYATKFDVILAQHCHDHHDHHDHHEHRTYADICELIDSSSLNLSVKNLSKRIFLRVAKAEAKVHNKPVSEVHFHEVGAVDSIIDIVAAAICVEILKPDVIIASPLTEGTGFVTCQHGILSVPVPATLEIVKDCGAPLSFINEPTELVTPTGAAIVCELAERFDIMPSMTVHQIGFGAGTKDLSGRANVLRLILGKNEPVYYESSICIIETNIDNFTGEGFGYLMDKLFEQGAKDVWYTPIFMKKNRPAYKLSVLCDVSLKDSMERLIFKESPTIGIRSYQVDRTVMEREIIEQQTRFGTVQMKHSTFGDIQKTIPEYESLKTVVDEEFYKAYCELLK